MGNRVLLLGNTGKMGSALEEVFASDYSIIGKNTNDFDACNLAQVEKLIEEIEADIVINSVAFLGIDPCEKEPTKAFMINTLYPKLLAQLSNKMSYLLVHFSTDAVFNDDKGDFYTEEDAAKPLNLYGLTKYGADCLIQSISESYYIFRVPILFGETNKNTQFVEKMLQLLKDARKILKISDDIISSPTYSKDVAKETRRIIEQSLPYGLYHLSNKGKGSLYDLMKKVVEGMALDVEVQKASYRDFPFVGRKNTCTPIQSVKVNSLRPWEEAVEDYCKGVELNGG